MNEQLFNITTDWLGGWDLPATIEDVQEVIEQPDNAYVYTVEEHGYDLRVYATRSGLIEQGQEDLGVPSPTMNWIKISKEFYYLVIGEAAETENTTEQWLHEFMRQYEQANHTRLSYQIFEGIFGEAASLKLYRNNRNFVGHVSVDIDPVGETIVNWVSGSTTTTVETAIATRDLMNVAIEVALAWSALRAITR